MSSVRLNLAIIMVIASGCAAGLAASLALGGFATSLTPGTREALTMALPALTAIAGAVGGYLLGTASLPLSRSSAGQGDPISEERLRLRVERQLFGIALVAITTALGAFGFSVGMRGYLELPLLGFLENRLLTFSGFAMLLIGIGLLVKVAMIRRTGNGWQNW